jgi:hypothetical protein
VEGHTVRLGGFRRQDPLMVSFVDAWGRERIDVLVIDPHTDPSYVPSRSPAAPAAQTDRGQIMDLAAQ